MLSTPYFIVYLKKNFTKIFESLRRIDSKEFSRVLISKRKYRIMLLEMKLRF